MKKLSVSMSRNETILGWIYLLLYFLILPLVLQIANLLLGSPMDEAEFNFVFFATNFLCVVVIFWRFLIENGKRALKNVPAVLLGTIAGFFLYQLLSLAVGIFITYVYPDFFNVNDETINSMVQQKSQLMAMGVVMLVPLTEEVLFRGLFFQGLYRKSPILAYLISVLAFAALHVVGYIGQYEPAHLLLCLLQYFPAGISLAWACHKSGTIVAPILIHATVNAMGIAAMR